MSVDIASLLAVDLSGIKKPDPLPQATYTLVIKEMETGESSKKQTPYVRFVCQPIGCEEADAAQKLGTIDLSKRTLNIDFYLTTDAMWRLKDFLPKIGLPNEGMLNEVLSQAPGRSFKAWVAHEQSTKTGDDSVYSRIDSNKILPA